MSEFAQIGSRRAQPESAKDKPLPEWPARERELFTHADTSRLVDFHSTRRAYATGSALANVNAQIAQVLSGHSNAKVHQCYVVAATITALPEATAPDLSAVDLQKAMPGLLLLVAIAAPALQKSKALVLTKAFSVGARRFDRGWPESSLLDRG